MVLSRYCTTARLRSSLCYELQSDLRRQVPWKMALARPDQSRPRLRRMHRRQHRERQRIASFFQVHSREFQSFLIVNPQATSGSYMHLVLRRRTSEISFPNGKAAPLETPRLIIHVLRRFADTTAKLGIRSAEAELDKPPSLQLRPSVQTKEWIEHLLSCSNTFRFFAAAFCSR